MAEKQKTTTKNLAKIDRLLRYWILDMTTAAGSGHPSSSLSSVELMSTLFFGGFLRYNTDTPDHIHNDRVIFSKGHASPLFFALWAAAGTIEPEELQTFRHFWSRLEGHPTQHFPHTFAMTGSLGQGLSVGLGAALGARLDQSASRTWVLLGDSEMAEGQVWEAMVVAAHYKCDNLIAIVDVNRLGQRGETMHGHDARSYHARAQACGWHAITVDGHDTEAITAAYTQALTIADTPVMIIATTQKGRGVKLLEDQEGWHGKVLDAEACAHAQKKLGTIDLHVRGHIARAESEGESVAAPEVGPAEEVYTLNDTIAVRDGYGAGLVDALRQNRRIVVLDAEVSNSTRAARARDACPERFFEMYIAEQNMASVAHGLALRGFVPYISSFAAFLVRAHDQIRMASLDEVHMVCAGSHAGVSIGEDGGSQMGLTDIAFFRALLGSVVLAPADAQAARWMTLYSAQLPTMTYIRTVRAALPVLYPSDEEFPVGGSKTLCQSIDDYVSVIAMGITVHEALAAYEILKAENITIRVIDAYSIKPIDVRTIKKAAAETHRIIVVEDHYAEGALGDAVRAAVSEYAIAFTHLCVHKPPRSGKPQELLAYEEIDASAIVRSVRSYA